MDVSEWCRMRHHQPLDRVGGSEIWTCLCRRFQFRPNDTGVTSPNDTGVIQELRDVTTETKPLDQNPAVVESSTNLSNAREPTTATDDPWQINARSQLLVRYSLDRLAYQHTWTPQAAAVVAVIEAARLHDFLLTPDEHLDHYISRCSELKRTPSATEWVRWFHQDQSKRLAEERSNVRTEQPLTDDTGTPLSWSKKAGS